MGDVGMEDHQICIAHLLRNLTYTAQAFPDDAWSLDMLDLLRDSVHQRHQGNIGQDVRTKMEERLDELLARLPVYTREDGKETELDKLKKSIAKHRDHVFTFLTNPAVPPTNNDDEKALRPAKTKLKVSEYFRTEAGVENYATVASVIQTADGTPAKKSDKPTKVKYIKMFVIDNLKSKTIDGKVKMYVNPDSTITSDDSKSYTNFKSLVKEHVHQVIEPAQVGKILPWVHIAISNAKRLLLDVYHDITPDYLQNYLNEFCYKFNRRRFGNGLFDRLMVAALAYKNDFRYNIA